MTQNRIELKSGMTRGVLLFILFSSIIWARGFGSDELDSLDRMPPNLRYYYMQKNSLEEFNEFLRPDSQGVRMVGKWGRGSSSRVTGRDSLVFLSLGSEVAIINIANPSNPQIVYEVQARGGVAKSVLKDSFLFIGGPGIEIWNIANPSSPIFRNRIITGVSDFCIRDNFLYAIAGDSFRIFNITNIMNPQRISTIREVGYYLSISGNYAYISDRWGLYIVNIQNPANPYRVNSWGSAVLSAQARDSFCYVSTYDPMNPSWLRFTILNVANPNAIQVVSYINYAGGYDIYLLSYFAYVSGYYLPVGEFQIIDISNPSFPTVVSRCTTPGWNNGVWANNPFGNAYVADDWEGLKVININNPTNPYIDTSMMGAEYALDIWLDRNYAYVANRRSGLKIIDLTNHAIPFQVGEYDTIGDRYDMYSATAKDSFAYIGAPIPYLKFGTIDVSNHSSPILAGTTSIFGYAQDMVLRDSFVYIAENYRFQIYNVARPRQPRLVGSCNLPNAAGCIFLKDSLAFVGSLPSPIININNPSNPTIIGNVPEGPYGICVKDTFAFLAINYGGLQIWSVANPASPYLIDTIYYQRGYDVIVIDSIAYFGGLDFRILNVANPGNAFEIGRYTTPYRVRRLFYDNGLIYAACFSAGMVILEPLESGIEENQNDATVKKVLRIIPNPNLGRFSLDLNRDEEPILIYNLAGKLVMEVVWQKRKPQINISNLPDGVYFVFSKYNKNKILTKVVKIGR